MVQQEDGGSQSYVANRLVPSLGAPLLKTGLLFREEESSGSLDSVRLEFYGFDRMMIYMVRFIVAGPQPYLN